MRFGKTLRNNTLKEWRFYSVDYKQLKQTLNGKAAVTEEPTPSTGSYLPTYNDSTNSTKQVNQEEFFRILDHSKDKLVRFYEDKESWALTYIKTLEERLDSLRECAADPPSPASTTTGESTECSSIASDSYDSCSEEEEKKCIDEEVFFSRGAGKRLTRTNSDWLKEEYRRMGRSTHFHNFIYAKKSISTFDRELSLLLEFLDLNKTAFSKILKKFDKVTSSSIREEHMEEVLDSLPFLDGEVLQELKCQVTDMLEEVEQLKPRLPEGWGERKVYTIGCFDLFHRGHQNVLMSLREFGYFIVAGIHDDESYFKLKNKYTIDNLETRMNNVKPFVDQLFVIPSTDPLLYIKTMVSEQDIETGRCCYARGDDMLQFPGREWVESVMPVHFVPRTESCSSTLIRTIYHDGDAELRRKAAFAKTRYDGKPIDENGEVLKLSKSCPVITVSANVTA